MKKRSLMDVVHDRRIREDCILCECKEREEIEEGRRNGAELRDIVAYLIKDCGYDEALVRAQQNSRMTKHFKYHVQDTEAKS